MEQFENRVSLNAQSKKSKKTNKLKRILLITLAVFVVVLIVWATVDSYMMSSRKTYKTEQEMQADLQGTWVSLKDNVAIEIGGNKLTHYNYSDDGYKYDIEFFPNRGTISLEKSTLSEQYVVKRYDDSIYLEEYKMGYYGYDPTKYYEGKRSSLGKDPNATEYMDDMIDASLEADRYIKKLKNEQPNISSIAYDYGSGICQGEFYTFECRVIFTDETIRDGKITIIKSESGEFETKDLLFNK